jgi:excinuclease ABC subunit A
VVVIEHNPRLISQADYVVELGPDAGPDGGQVIAACRPNELIGAKHSIIGSYLRLDT